MRKVKIIFCFINVAGLLFGFSSCTNVQTKNQEKNNNQVESITDSSSNSGLKNNDREIFLLLSPGEILERFYDAKIQYIPEHLNPIVNKGKYIGSKSQAMNLGVYISDMAYSALFERSTETVDYLETIRSLSSELGISSNIFESLIIRSKANVGKIDSLVTISNEAFIDMLEFLETGGKDNTIALISAGAYIESLYLALQSMDKYSETSIIPELVADMKYPMDNLLEKTKNVTVSENDNDKTLINYINQISDIFHELGTNSSKTIITRKQTGVISISGGARLTVNETEFNKLKNSVTEIRNNIVSF